MRTAAAAPPPDAAAPPPDAAAPGLFGTIEIVNHAPPQWLFAIHRLRAERAVFQRCAADPASCPSARIVDWLDKLETMRGLAPMQQIDAVNRAVNRWAYKADFRNFNRIDHWASPTEFMRQSGDCEDYVIFKMFSLMLLGHARDSMRIVLVRDTVNRADHAVLAVYLDAGTYILDNNEARVLPHRSIAQYVPLLSFGWRRSFAHVAPPVPVERR